MNDMSYRYSLNWPESCHNCSAGGNRSFHVVRKNLKFKMFVTSRRMVNTVSVVC